MAACRAVFFFGGNRLPSAPVVLAEEGQGQAEAADKEDGLTFS